MKELLGEALRADPRVAEAKRLVLEALTEHRGRLTGIRPPNPGRKEPYEQLVNRLGDLRGSSLFFPYLGSGLGKGPLVELADGSVKYDFICGIGVHYFGHSHPSFVEAAIDAALADVVMQGNLQQNPEAEGLADLLLQAANRRGAGLEHVFLTTSGAMANENALKMVLQKHAPASRVLAFEGCFAGRSLALAQITDRPAYRDGLPPGLPVDYVPFFDAEDPDGSTQQALSVLRKHLARYPGQHAAMFFELVLGEGGVYPGESHFFRTLMKEVREHGVAVVVDEVQTFGRTPEAFAFQFFALDDLVDLVAVGKLSQVCATVFRKEYRPRPGLVGQTFTGSTAAILSARVVLTELLRGDYFGPNGKNARLQNRFEAHLARIAAEHPDWIRGPFGVGAMVAFTPFDGEPETAKRVVHALFDAGVIGFTAGSSPARVRFLVPAGAATEQDVDEVCTVLKDVMDRLAADR